MKGIGIGILLAALLILSACGGRGRNGDETGTPAAPVVPQEGVVHNPVIPQNNDAAEATPAGHVFLTPEVRPGLGGIPITWGFNPAMYGYELLNFEVTHEGGHRAMYLNTDIQAFLRDYFDVQLEGVYVSNEDIITLRSRGMAEADAALGLVEATVSVNAADIFIANPSHVQGDVMTRTIPEEMIRRYAPNYAALLDKHKGWELSRAANGEQSALNTFNAYQPYLDVFSVYRLEWLEELEIPLPGLGHLHEVADGVYFSSDSYNMHEFLLIMDAFTRNEPNPNPITPRGWSENLITEAFVRTWSMEINSMGDIFQAISPILGMFGVNTSIVEENGKAVPFYASQNYRMALQFLQDLSNRDVILHYGGNNGQHSTFICNFIRVGWAPVRTRDLMNVIQNAQSGSPDRRFLITPPENGGVGYRGVGLSQSSSLFNPDGKAWVIAHYVDDDTLSRILNMFDAMSFDPDIFTFTAYGFYRQRGSLGGDSLNQRIIWSGEPFQSIATLRRAPYFTMREGVFFTGIIDGVTFPQSLFGEYEIITRFAQSDAGMRLNLHPAREDIRGEFAAERAYLDSKYFRTLWEENGEGFDIGAVMWYLRGILSGRYTVADTWDEYMEMLNANGLQEYIELFSRFPK
jgi:hypothetical protein